MSGLFREEIRRIVGNVPQDKNNKFRSRHRIHQGWWRSFVLAEEQGRHPELPGEYICNTILNGADSRKNFLSSNTKNLVSEFVQEWRQRNTGKIDDDRLYNNLLSSQPLCINFFGELAVNTNLASSLLENYIGEPVSVTRVFFEYASADRYLGDNSAFDVAFEIHCGKKKGIFGLECKYTDTFSYRPKGSQVNYGDIGNKNHDAYVKIYNSAKDRFLADYDVFVKDKRFNQLFRNELIGRSLLVNGNYDFAITGLFCHHDDSNAIECGREFQRLIARGEESFKVITYKDYLGKLQRLDINWELREWTMLLWARYCGLILSEEVTSRW